MTRASGRLWSRRGFALRLGTAATAAIGRRALAAEALYQDLPAALDRQIEAILAKTGAPSASIAVVRPGKPVWAKAYGAARRPPWAAAQVSTRYCVGSISKQFTAAGLLILQTQGRLLLDDPLSRWFPDLTSADKITVRQVLTHTAGYEDYYPQDYTPSPLLTPVAPEAIISGWGTRPLDFLPGEAWQYSNTGYVIAGRIVERVSGQSLFSFLKTTVFDPLAMTSVVDNDARRIAAPDAQGFVRAALGPVRPVNPEGQGWMFGAGELAMSASDLARWDISVINHSLLTPDAYNQLTTTMSLKSGDDTGYALGLFVSKPAGRRLYEHSGEIAGFVAENRVYPDQKVAIVVLTNLEATEAARSIADHISDVVLEPDQIDDTVRKLFIGLQRGDFDRRRLAPNLDGYFSVQTVTDFSSSLGPLGAPLRFQRRSEERRGGMQYRNYRVTLAEQTVTVSVYILPDGRLEQFLVAPAP